MNIELINKIMTADKKGIQTFASANSLQIIDEGNTDIVAEFIKARRLQEYLDTYITGLKAATKNEISRNGNKLQKGSDEVTIVAGRCVLDYESDAIYKDLKTKLEARKLQLDMVFKTKQTSYDSDGCEIPLIDIKSITEDSLMLKIK